MNPSQLVAPARKDALLALMDRGRKLTTAWAESLAAEMRSADPAQTGWDAKYVLAHLARWNRALLTALELKARGEPVPYQWADVDGENARLMAACASRTWDEAAADAESAYAALRGWVARLSEAELAAVDDFAWQEGWPLWQTFLGNTYFHTLDHLAEYYTASGQPGQAAALRAELHDVYEAHGLAWS